MADDSPAPPGPSPPRIISGPGLLAAALLGLGLLPLIVAEVGAIYFLQPFGPRGRAAAAVGAMLALLALAFSARRRGGRDRGRRPILRRVLAPARRATIGVLLG